MIEINRTKLTTMEVLIIILFSLICTIIMGYLDAYERLQLFIFHYNLTVFDEFIIFFPAFIAIGFILFSTKRVQELGQEIIKRQNAETALRESENNYRQLSITDELTGLYNQRHFFKRLKAELDRAQRYSKTVSLILMDVDDFKIFNDSHGHLEGDKVLRRAGQIILSHIRSSDSAFRYGGEEFVVIMPETGASSTVNVAERIRKKFKSHAFEPQENSREHLTISIGMAEYASGEAMDAFVKRADANMYKAKELGKDRLYYLPK